MILIQIIYSTYKYICNRLCSLFSDIFTNCLTSNSLLLIYYFLIEKCLQIFYSCSRFLISSLQFFNFVNLRGFVLFQRIIFKLCSNYISVDDDISWLIYFTPHYVIRATSLKLAAVGSQSPAAQQTCASFVNVLRNPI